MKSGPWVTSYYYFLSTMWKTVFLYVISLPWCYAEVYDSKKLWTEQSEIVIQDESSPLKLLMSVTLLISNPTVITSSFSKPLGLCLILHWGFTEPVKIICLSVTLSQLGNTVQVQS